MQYPDPLFRGPRRQAWQERMRVRLGEEREVARHCYSDWRGPSSCVRRLGRGVDLEGWWRGCSDDPVSRFRAEILNIGMKLYRFCPRLSHPPEGGVLVVLIDCTRTKENRLRYCLSLSVYRPGRVWRMGKERIVLASSLNQRFAIIFGMDSESSKSITLEWSRGGTNSKWVECLSSYLRTM